MEYFPHYVTSSSSRDLNTLRATHGSVAVDAYWMILEIMYESEKPLDLSDNSPTLAMLEICLNVAKAKLKQILKLMFELNILQKFSDDKNVFSQDVLDDIKKINSISKRRSDAGRKGGLAKARNLLEQKPSTKTKTKTKTKTILPKGFTPCNVRCENKRHGKRVVNQIASPEGVLYCPVCDKALLEATSDLTKNLRRSK